MVKAAKVSEEDMAAVQAECERRVGAAERKAYALAKERDALRRGSDKLSSANDLLKEKDNIIAQVAGLLNVLQPTRCLDRIFAHRNKVPNNPCLHQLAWSTDRYGQVSFQVPKRLIVCSSKVSIHDVPRQHDVSRIHFGLIAAILVQCTICQVAKAAVQWHVPCRSWKRARG